MRIQGYLSAIVLVVTVGAASGSSLITFEAPLPPGLTPNGTYIDGQSVSASADITNQFANLGIVLTTAGGAPYAALIDLGTGHAVSGTNGIGPVDINGSLNYNLDLDIFLVVPGTTTPAVTDQISIRGDEESIPGNVIFTAYDVNGNQIASGTQPDTPGGTYSLSAAGIHEFRIYSETGTVAYDDLAFDVPTATPIPVGTAPEPASIGLLGAGIAAVVVRRRRRFAR